MKIIKIHSKKFGNFKILVSNQDYKRLSQYTWGIVKCGPNKFYASRRTRINELPPKRKTYMHHCILPLKFGFETDHKDNNGLNNQRSNLRRVTRQQNVHNGSHRGGVSKHKGVSFDKARNKWVAVCGSLLRKRYDTEQEAAEAYNLAAKKLYGKYAKLNIL